MDCPICQNKLTTTNSRKTAGGAATWRRKHCVHCHSTFTSRESLDLSGIIQINDKPYSKERLISKLARLISSSSAIDLPSIVETIESRLLKLSRHHHTITKQAFTSEVMTVLEKIDRSAYLRYQAEVEET